MAQFIQKRTLDEALDEAMRLCPVDPSTPRVRQFVEFGFRLLEMLDVVQFRDPAAEPVRSLEDLNDRELSNVIHGRAPDDNGEFTASSMGAEQDRLRNDIAKGGG